MHILEQSAAFIALHVNATKTEYMCYSQDGPVETLNKTPLKKVDDFYISAAISPLLKKMFSEEYRKHGVLFTNYEQFGNLHFLSR